MTDQASIKPHKPTLRLVHGHSRTGVDTVELVQAALLGEVSAYHRLYDMHAPHVARVLRNVLGSDQDAGDVLHDTFVVVLERLGTLENPSLFRTWVTRIAVFKARGLIRKRSRHRWLRVLSGEDPIEEPVNQPPSDEVDEALGATYEILGMMPVEERIAFVLRRLEGLGVGEVATLCGVSLSTIKRRIGRAEDSFYEKASKHPVLTQWMQGEDQ